MDRQQDHMVIRDSDQGFTVNVREVRPGVVWTGYGPRVFCKM